MKARLHGNERRAAKGACAAALIGAPLAVFGCGDVGDPGAGSDADEGEAVEGLEEIRLDPAEAEVIVDGGEPASQAFEVIGTFEDGGEEEVTEQASFSLQDPALGSISGARFESGSAHGGQTRVSATVGEATAHADLTVRIRERERDADADLPDGVGEDFDGAEEDDDYSPEIVYPVPEVLLPPNLDEFEIHLIPSGGAELFELSFSSATTDVAVYTSCAEPVGEGCVYTPDPELWRRIARSNRGGHVDLEARAMPEEGGAAGASAAQEIAFSEDDLRGAIYYWTTSEIIDEGDDTGIMRYDFAAGQEEPEIFVDPSDTEGNCVGCHSLSPDGSKMFTAAGGDGGQVLLMDVEEEDTLVPFDSTPRSAYAAWSPTGDRFAGTYSLEDQDEEQDGWLSYNLNFFDGDTGEHLETVDLGGTPEQPISQPDWSPEGDQITFIHMGAMAGAFGGGGTHAFAIQASIGVIEEEGDGWSEPVFLTDPPEGENTFFPAFNPDGELIAFNRSTCPDGENGSACYAHGDPDATLFVMEPEEGAEPIELARANEPGPMDEGDVVMNSFPKWTPFTFEGTEEFGGRLQWISFASDRQYGLREPGDEEETLIWMAGVDPTRALAGEDPSRPAFALPFQAVDTDNHTAQWTETTVIIE